MEELARLQLSTLLQCWSICVLRSFSSLFSYIFLLFSPSLLSCLRFALRSFSLLSPSLAPSLPSPSLLARPPLSPSPLLSYSPLPTRRATPTLEIDTTTSLITLGAGAGRQCGQGAQAEAHYSSPPPTRHSRRRRTR